jgi:hypothetical protein
MTVAANLNECYVLDVLQTGSATETITISVASVVNSYDFFDSPLQYIVKGIIVTTITATGGALLDVYKGSVGGANKLCVQVSTASTGITLAQLAPAGALSASNLTIDGNLIIQTTGANSENRIQLLIGKATEKSVDTAIT